MSIVVVRRTILASIIILIVIAVSAYSLYSLKNSETTGESSKTTIKLMGRSEQYTLLAGPGSFLSYNSTVYYFSANGTIINDTTTFNITIVDYTWPIVVANYTTSNNRSGAANLLVGNVALPEEMLGLREVSIPLTIPFANDALCMPITLVGEDEMKVGSTVRDVYVYNGTAKMGRVVVAASLYYDRETGLMVKSNITIILDGKPLFRHVQVLVDAKTAGSLTVSTGESWICEPPLSSNIMLVWEGIYRVSKGPSLELASVNDVRAALRGDAVIVVIAKDGRNLTNMFWQKILAYAQRSSMPTYVIVLGGMTTPDVQVFAKNILDRVGAVEPVVAIKFKKGQAVAKAYSFAREEELASIFEP